MYEIIYYQVRDVMTPNPITVRQDIILEDLETIFEEHDFNGVPVVDEGHRLIGMVTKLDLIRAFVVTERVKTPYLDAIMRKAVSQVMVQKIHVFNPETPITNVLQSMIETKHKSFPVVEGERVVGIVAREDVLRALQQSALGLLPERLRSSDMQGQIEARH
jgi:CBS domain-containing protein